MSSNMLSRMLPSTSGMPSIYEAIREHDQIAGQLSHEADDYHDDAAVDENNLREPFQDQDVADLLVEATESPIETEHTPFLDDVEMDRELGAHQPTSPALSRGLHRPKWMRKKSGGKRRFAEEDDVPESLLLEDDRSKTGLSSPEDNPKTADLPDDTPGLPLPVPGPSSRQAQAQWRTTQARQALYDEPKQQAAQTRRSEPSKFFSASTVLLNADPAQKALWKWTNVENLDNFLNELYVYYLDKGIYPIILTRFLGLLTTAFVVGIVTFLGHCIDYRLIPSSQSLNQVLIPRCTAKMSGFTNIFLWMFAFLWVFKVFEYILDIRRLKHLHDFYLYLLEIPDDEMQTISWQEIVGRLMNLRDANPRTAVNKQAPQVNKFLGGDKSKQRMDAHDIANRLMRRENYLIALFNKDVLDLTLPIPFLGSRQLFSKTLEWSIDLAVMDYVFNEQGQVRQLFLKDTERQRLIEALQWRFKFIGLANVMCAPFIIAYLLFFYFLRYFTEFSKNPAQLGSRAYTPLAEWKFREFNELRHLFERRTDMSYPYASRYMDQFPKYKTVELAKFVAFIAGSLAAILGVATVFDPELFLGFHVTPDRTAFFYLGVLVPLWAVARGMVPDENLVFDPEFAIQEVINFTHYCPSTWKGRLHTDDVRREFSSLYKLKLLIFLEEIMSIIFAPFVLWFSLPQCSERLIDFFREFTIHVDGLGYVCSFALFDFKKGTPAPSSSTKPRAEEPDVDPRGDYYSTKDGKMLASYYSFLDSYAHNPRRGANSSRRQPYLPAAAAYQRQFNPPPTFPGISSSPTSPQQNFRESPVLRTSNRPMSPSPSMLLDPHHQPSRSMAGLGRSTLTRRQHQQSSQPPLKEEAEEDEVGEESYELSAGMDEPDPLASTAADDTSTGETGGVLGLLYQFQKAQTETGRGKGAGIGI